MIRLRMLGAAGLTVALLIPNAILAATKPKANAPAESARAASAPAPEPAALMAEIEELKRVLAEQAGQLASHRQALEEQQEQIQQLQLSLAAGSNGAAAAPSPVEQHPPLERISNELDAVARSQAPPQAGQADMAAKVDRVNQEFTDAQKKNESRLAGLGNFRFSGDVRVRFEPFFQEGAQDRHRQRIRARFNILGNIGDQVFGGLTLASGDLNDPIATNQSFTDFYKRKPLAFDRFFVTYKPKQLKYLSFTGGKFPYPWYRTELTFDSDLNPEGFAGTFSYDFKNPVLKNITLVGFQSPFREVSGSFDSFMAGGQLQTRWRITDQITFLLTTAGIKFHEPNTIASVIGGGAGLTVTIPANSLGPGVPAAATSFNVSGGTPVLGGNPLTNRTTGSGSSTAYSSKFLYWDSIAQLDFNYIKKWPVRLLLNVVDNTQASTGERTGYWGELRFGRAQEKGDVQFGYTFIRIEQDAVLAALNFSDLRAGSNLRNHRLDFAYRAFKNVSLHYTLFVGQSANPRAQNSAIAPANCPSRTDLTRACTDPYLKRMQFDVVYSF